MAWCTQSLTHTHIYASLIHSWIRGPMSLGQNWSPIYPAPCPISSRNSSHVSIPLSPLLFYPSTHPWHAMQNSPLPLGGLESPDKTPSVWEKSTPSLCMWKHSVCRDAFKEFNLYLVLMEGFNVTRFIHPVKKENLSICIDVNWPPVCQCVWLGFFFFWPEYSTR